MKLATLRNGSRDGQLVVVSRDLSKAVAVSQIASTMQAALDDWAHVSPKVLEVSDALEKGSVSGAFAFDPDRAMAPLPRA